MSLWFMQRGERTDDLCDLQLFKRVQACKDASLQTGQLVAVHKSGFVFSNEIISLSKPQRFFAMCVLCVQQNADTKMHLQYSQADQADKVFSTQRSKQICAEISWKVSCNAMEG